MQGTANTAESKVLKSMEFSNFRTRSQRLKTKSDATVRNKIYIAWVPKQLVSQPRDGRRQTCHRAIKNTHLMRQKFICMTMFLWILMRKFILQKTYFFYLIHPCSKYLRIQRIQVYNGSGAQGQCEQGKRRRLRRCPGTRDYWCLPTGKWVRWIFDKDRWFADCRCHREVADEESAFHHLREFHQL